MAPSTPTPRPGVLDIEAYVPGESHVPGGLKPIKLSSNETPLGPSPKAVAAFAAAGAALERYPDGQATALRQAIARRFGLNADRIVCGAGSDELISLIAHAYLGPGDEAVFTEHGFLLYRIVVLAAGATPVVAPETRAESRRRRHPRQGDGQNQGRVPRQPEQSDRHLPRHRGGAPSARQAAGRTCCWCSTPPMPNTSAATITRPASSSSPPPTTR